MMRSPRDLKFMTEDESALFTGFEETRYERRQRKRELEAENKRLRTENAALKARIKEGK